MLFPFYFEEVPLSSCVLVNFLRPHLPDALHLCPVSLGIYIVFFFFFSFLFPLLPGPYCCVSSFSLLFLFVSLLCLVLTYLIFQFGLRDIFWKPATFCSPAFWSPPHYKTYHYVLLGITCGCMRFANNCICFCCNFTMYTKFFGTGIVQKFLCAALKTKKMK